MGETFHFDTPADRDAVCPLHIDCALDRAALHAIACKRMHKDRYIIILHNMLRNLKGVEAGGTATAEPSRAALMTFLPISSVLLFYAMLSRRLLLLLRNKQRLRSMSASSRLSNRAPIAMR